MAPCASAALSLIDAVLLPARPLLTALSARGRQIIDTEGAERVTFKHLCVRIKQLVRGLGSGAGQGGDTTVMMVVPHHGLAGGKVLFPASASSSFQWLYTAQDFQEVFMMLDT